VFRRFPQWFERPAVEAWHHPVLNDAGKDGWELVTISPNNVAQPNENLERDRCGGPDTRILPSCQVLEIQSSRARFARVASHYGA
jgi:hypothetical protein